MFLHETIYHAETLFQDNNAGVFLSWQKIELTEEQLTHLGYELADIRRTVEMANHYDRNLGLGSTLRTIQLLKKCLKVL